MGNGELSKELAAFEQVAQIIHPQCRLQHAGPLAGGVSAQVTALEILLHDGGRRRLVVRRHGDADLKRNPNVAEDEFRLLQVLSTKGILAPRPVFFDPSRRILPAPYLVVEYVEGSADPAPLSDAGRIIVMAEQLAAIHRLRVSNAGIAFLPKQAPRLSEWFRERSAHCGASADDFRIREALAQVWPLSSPDISALLHGDFWPGNILWKDGRIAAVVDWEDAELGDPLADLANSRLEILWAFGLEAMRCFTSRYESLAPADYSRLPYWDLYAALHSAPKISKWGLHEAAEIEAREKLGMFIAMALDRIDGTRPEGEPASP